MSILRPSNMKRKTKLVGASFPVRVHRYMSTYALAKGITKTDILFELVNQWIKKQEVENPESALAPLIVERALNQWKKEKEMDSLLTFRQFKINLSKELAIKGVYKNLIEKILLDISPR